MSTTASTGLSQRGLNGVFFPRFLAAMVIWREVCSLINSTGKQEDFRWLGQIPMPSEWKGKRRTQALRDYGMSLVNKHWELTIPIDRDEADDDQTGQINLRVQEGADRFAQHPDKLLTDLIEAATAAVCYDGQYFFDTDHSEGDSGSQSNSIQYDVTTTTDPTEAEFEKAFFKCIEALIGLKDDQGEPWNMMLSMDQLDGLLVYVPKGMFRVACKVLGANAAGIINNTTNILAKRSRVVVNPRSAWTDKFAVFKTDDTMRPFIFQDRKKVESELIDVKTEKDILYALDGRYALGYGLWQKAVLCTLV